MVEKLPFNLATQENASKQAFNTVCMKYISEWSSMDPDKKKKAFAETQTKIDKTKD